MSYSATDSELLSIYGQAMLRVQSAQRALFDVTSVLVHIWSIPSKDSLLSSLRQDPWVGSNQLMLFLEGQAQARANHYFTPITTADLDLLRQKAHWLKHEYLLELGDRVAMERPGRWEDHAKSELIQLGVEFDLLERHLHTLLLRLSEQLRVPEDSLPEFLATVHSANNVANPIGATTGEHADSLPSVEVRSPSLQISLGEIAAQQVSHKEGLRWLRRGLSAASRLADDESIARAHSAIARLALGRGDLAAASSGFEAARVIYQKRQDWANLTQVDFALLRIAERQQNWQLAISRARALAETAARNRDIVSAGRAMTIVGDSARALGTFDVANQAYDRAIALLRESGDRSAMADALVGVAGIHSARGNFGEAVSWLDKSIAILETTDDWARRASAYLARGRVAQSTGNTRGAEGWYRKADALGTQLRDDRVVQEARKRLAALRVDYSESNQPNHTSELSPEIRASSIGGVSGPAIQAFARVGELTPGQQDIVLSNFPSWVVDSRVTEVVRLSIEISTSGDLTDVAAAFFEDRPDTIVAKVLHAVPVAPNLDALAVIALFPSNAIRTVGQVSGIRGEGNLAEIELFDYWSLVDPDDEIQTRNPPEKLAVHLVVAGLLP